MSDTEELPVLEGYDAWAPLYDDDGNPLTAIEEPVLQSWYGPLESRRVLDLGCGTGRHTLPLAMSGASVVAVDGSAEMLARARHKLRGFSVTWQRHILPAPLPYPDSSFDLIVLGLVSEHIEDLPALFEETYRLARSGARCLVSILHPDRTATGQRARFIDPSTGHRRQISTIHRTIEDYREQAGQAGWVLVEERSLVVKAEVGETLPRALPYVGKNLGWAAWWCKIDMSDPHF